MNSRPSHHVTIAALLLASVVGVATVGPSLGRSLADRLDHDEGVAVPFVPPADTIDVGATPPIDDPEVASAPPIPSLPGSEGQSASVPVPVETIAVVPSQRDVIVEIDGVRLASDDEGRIAVPELLRGGTVTVIGRAAEPVVEQVAFSAWADGDTRAVRPLAGITGPVAQLGLTVSTNVTVVSTTPTPEGAAVRFSSADGVVEVPVGASQWVVATLPVGGPSGLTTVDLTYTAVSIVDETGATELPSQAFAPTPEALWEVRP